MSEPRQLEPLRAVALPGAAALLLVVFAASNRANPELYRALLGAGGLLVAWGAALLWNVNRSGRSLTMSVAIHRHHWVQVCAQLTILLYWGWYIRFVYAFLPLIAAQVVFAYGVDSLLTWSRRDNYRLGFGPVPIILSINLFLWFRPEWFHWQFVMIVLGYLGKDLIRWQRSGRSAHIFNPSSFPLGVFALALILTGSSDLTFGNLIANSQFDPPHMYLVIFLASVPGQLLFGVASMTLSAVVALVAIGGIFFGSTGTFLFYDAFIPVPVFLGMHLLFTDPSTAPRSELGRVLFGVLYACAVAIFFVVLSRLGIPTFYDKLLPVPLLNLMVRRLDGLAESPLFSRLDPTRLGRSLSLGRRNFAYTSGWVGVFAIMSVFQIVGDRHPGQYLPFWREACGEGSDRACAYASYLTLSYCNNGSGWACNEAGIILRRRGQGAEASFRRACELGFQPGCDNVARRVSSVDELARSEPTIADLPIVLRGTKPPLTERDPERLYALGCRQGWTGMCRTTS